MTNLKNLNDEIQNRFPDFSISKVQNTKILKVVNNSFVFLKICNLLRW
jgi:hypothetical protein